MKHIELSPRRQEKFLAAIESIGIDPQVLGNYLREKLQEDNTFNELKKEVMEKQDFFERKELLLSIEYLSVVLTKTK